MKRAATHLFKKQSKNRVFCFIIELLLWFKTPRREDPRARQRSENPTQGQLECANPRGSPGGGMIRLGIYWYINKRENHKISNGKVLYFRGYQPKTSWGTPPPPSVSLGLIGFLFSHRSSRLTIFETQLKTDFENDKFHCRKFSLTPIS